MELKRIITFLQWAGTYLKRGLKEGKGFDKDITVTRL